MGKKVDEEGLGWTVGGIEQQDDAGRPCMWSTVTGKGATRTHAPARGWQAVGGRRSVTARALLFSSGVATGL